MAKQKTTDVKVRLLIEGFEGLDKIKSSFRDLGKVTNLAEKDILKARAGLKAIAKEAGNTEAVTAGLTSALKGLRTQAVQGGDAYKKLSADLRRLNEVSRGATDSLMAQRQAVLSTAAATTQNVAALTQQRDALVALRAQTRESSQAFEQFSGDIQRVEARLENLTAVRARLNSTLSRPRAGTSVQAFAELQNLEDGVALLREQLNVIDQRNAKDRNSKVVADQRLAIERELNNVLSQRRQIQFQEATRTARESVRTAAETFNNPDLITGPLSPENISRRVGDLPNTTAALNQELTELNERLVNTYRNTDAYLQIAMQMAGVQRELTSATQGYAQSLLMGIRTGVTAPSIRNIQQAISALRAEMLELDTSTSEGKRAYADNAREAGILERRLNKLASAYRHVSDAAKSVPAQGINPFTAAGATNPAYTAQQREELERVTRAAEARSLDAIDALLSAKRTMYEYEAGVLRTLDAEKDDLNNKDLARQRKIAKAEEEAFQKELQRLDIRKQQIAATKEAMGFNASRELSPLYGRIANLGASEVDRQQQLMGRNPTQVFNDIVDSFNAGGRPVDLKQRSTAIGGSVAEGVAQGANDSAATTTGARTFVDKLIRAYKAAFRIKSPSGESEEKIGIPIGQGIGQGILKGINGFKAQIKAAILDLTAQVGKAPLPLSMGSGSPLADRAQSQLARSTTRTSTYLPLTRLMGEGVLGSEAMSVAAERRMFENRSRVIPLGGAVPGGPQSYPSALSPQDRRGLRGTAGIPGAGLEAMIVSAVTKAVSRTGALAGPLNRPQAITVNIPSLLRPAISAGATRAPQSPLPVFSAPTQPTPLQATLPGMGYRMGGAPAPNFPIDGPLRGMTGPTGQKAAAASLTEAISKYRKAADNFWFSETSTFQTIRNIIGSGAQVAASKGALALSNVRLNTAGLTAAATKLTNLPSTTISNISSLLSGQGAKLTTTLQASGTQLRTQFTKLQTSADTLKTSTAQIFTGIGTGLTQRANTFRSGLTANLPFFGGSGGSGGPPIPPFPPAPPPPPPLPPTGGSSESFAKLNNGLKEFGPLSRRSVNSIQALGGALQEFKNDLSPIDDQYRLINREIEKQEKLIQRELTTRQRRQRAPLTGMQAAQGVGAAISGGIFGGPEGLLGGLGGLAVGGVGGAFAGAAAGAQLGMVRQQIAATGDYAASIGKMQIALRGVAGSQAAYDTAIRAAAAATRELNIPQEEATRGLTRLSAAVLGAGGTMGDATFAFRSISEAIKATGGNAEQVDGALLALTQVFSKGKVSAEELNQIAERLPGTFTLFAQAADKTGPELQKALQQGEVGLIDLMKFLDLAGERFGGTALKISGSSEEAGARLTVAFQAMRLEVGRAVLPLGAELQEAFAGFITSTTPGTVAAIGSIAGAIQFLIGNDIAAAIGGIALKLGAATLALKAFQAAAATTAGINLIGMLTGVGTGASITGGLFGAAVPKVNGFKAALTGLVGVFKSLAPFALLTFNIDLVIRNFNQLKETEAAIKKIKDDQSTFRPGLIGPVPLNTAERQFTGASSETVAAAQQKQQVFVAKLREDLKLLERQAKAVDTFIPDTNPISRALGVFGLDPSENFKKQKQDAVELQKLKIAQAEEILNLETRNYKTQAQQDAARRKSLEERFKLPAGSNEEAEKNREKLRDAFNKREDAMLEAREQREEKLADIRVQAAEQAKQIEQDLADTRRSLERELEDMARNRAYAAEDSERRIRGFRGEDPRLISAEQEIADIFRESRETAIANERRFSDEQEDQDRKIAEFQENIAKGIREANDAHTKKMGDIQKQYAKEVAKIVEKGGANTGKSIEQGGTNAAKQLAAAAKIQGLLNERNQLNLELLTITGKSVSFPDSGLPANQITTSKSVLQKATEDPRFTPANIKYIEDNLNLIDSIDAQLKTLNKQLNALPKAAPAAGPSSSAGPNRKPNQNGVQSSLPGEVPFSFDVSKLGQTFGDTASAALIEGLLAQQPRTTGAIGNMLPNTFPPPNFNDGLGAGRGHQGQDLGLDVGDTIHTRRAGKVVGIIEDFRRPGQRFMGSAVDVKYDNGEQGRYGHVQDIKVQPGQSVAAGQQLGTVFNDGQNTHLHYELRNGFGKLLDPLNAMKESLKVPPGVQKSVPLAVQRYVPASVAPAAGATTQLRDTAEAEAETTRVATQTNRIAEAYAQVNEQSGRLTLSLNEQLALLGSQRKYLDEGFSDSLSRSLASIDESSFADLEALNKKFNDTIAEGGEAVRAEAEALRQAELNILERNLQTNIDLTKEIEKQNSLLKIRQDDRIGLGMQEGVQSYLESIGTMRDATAQLTVQGIKGLEDAIFDLVTTGTTNFREFAANMLRDTARMIIQQLVLRNILRMVQNIFSPGGFANGGVFGPSMQPVAGYAKGGTFTKPMGGTISTYAKGGMFDEYAAGGAFAANKIMPFAKGSAFSNTVVSSPTLFKFASGGAMQTGVMGEAGPEAVMPLKRGPDGRLGVTSNATGASTNSSAVNNVTVNVDASGSKVQGDSNKSEQLGRAVSQAVQEELVRQKLPGGLLS